MNEKEIQELIDQFVEDIEAGKTFATEGTPPAPMTPELIEQMIQAIDEERRFKFVPMYFGIDWAPGRDRTVYYNLTT
jgi:fructose-1-phosphate kinase PfkB-like protein